jgi:hypothetical protein
MVGRAMGLLDDAIHEHLELKRLHGADPSEVIREEREAFGSAPRAEGTEPAAHVADFEEIPTARAGHAVDGIEINAAPNLSQLSQETVELDMRAVLEAESIEGNARAEVDTLPPASSAAPSHARVEPSASGGGSLEWEMPGERRHNFSERPREKGLAPVGRVLGTRKVPAGDALAGRLDSLRAASSQERI